MVLVSLVSLIETEEHKKDYSDESDDKKTIGHQGLGRVIFEVFRLSRHVVRIISIGGKGLSEQREETIGTTRSDYPDKRKVLGRSDSDRHVDHGGRFY